MSTLFPSFSLAAAADNAGDLSAEKLSELIKKLHDTPAWKFDRTPTPAILGFEVLIGVVAIAALALLPRVAKRVPARYGIMLAGVFLFEFFTSPMWFNHKLGPWAYVYQDVSWILTLGWGATILATVLLVDWRFPKMRELKRFGLYLVILTVAVCLLELVVVNLGIRSYSPEVRETVTGVYVAGVPIEILYYVPVFMTLVISFYKYWAVALDGLPVVPLKRTPWLRTFLLTLAGVFLFELMIEPMVVNAQFPQWSYLYHDISIVMSLTWVLVIWLATNLVDRVFIHFDLFHKFLAYLGISGFVSIPIESWLVANGYRVYGPTAVTNFSSFLIPGTTVPIEVALGTPVYLAFVILFVRYVEMVITNER